MERRRRIGRSEEIRRARQQGRCWSTDTLVLCARPTGAAISRFAFVVSKRQGDAVVRNRIKRRLREATRRLAADIPAGYDIVMIARGPIANRSSIDLEATIAGVLRRARLRPVAGLAPDQVQAATPGGPTP